MGLFLTRDIKLVILLHLLMDMGTLMVVRGQDNDEDNEEEVDELVDEEEDDTSGGLNTTSTTEARGLLAGTRFAAGLETFQEAEGLAQSIEGLGELWVGSVYGMLSIPALLANAAMDQAKKYYMESIKGNGTLAIIEKRYNFTGTVPQLTPLNSNGTNNVNSTAPPALRTKLS